GPPVVPPRNCFFVLAILVEPSALLGDPVAQPAATGEKIITISIGMKLAYIKPGSFMMGSPKDEEDRKADEQQHEVEIAQPFYMGVYLVTQEQYEKVMGSNPSYFTREKGGGPDYPVERVSWDDALAFCKKLSDLAEEKELGRVYRLPTEAEWEYAC